MYVIENTVCAIISRYLQQQPVKKVINLVILIVKKPQKIVGQIVNIGTSPRVQIQ